MSLNLVFCGTPLFAVPTLEKLVAAGFRVSLVVTQPDRPKGRGLELLPSPVKHSALKLNLPIIQPDRIKTNDAFRAQLSALKPDAIIVVGYGRLIPDWMLDLPPLGNINLHASLLPKYRGAAPIQWAIAGGETVTGVTTMRLDTGLDTGDILLQKEISIDPEDTAETLAPRLSSDGADLMIETLRGLQIGSITAHPQDNSKATLAPILKKEDGVIDFSRPATEISNRIRGFQPWPGAHTKFRGKNLQILKARPGADPLPSTELCVISDCLFVGCGGSAEEGGTPLLAGSARRGNTSLELLELQLEGKKRTSARDFIHGYRPQAGEKLG